MTTAPTPSSYYDEPLSFFDGDVCESGAFPILFGAVSCAAFVGAQILRHWKNTARTPEGLSADAEASKKVTSWYLEDWLIAPFIPKTFRSLLAQLFLSYFVVTVTMAYTRYRDSRWAVHVDAQMFFLNLITKKVFGCKALNTHVVDYPKYGETEDLHTSPKVRGFGPHLAAGMFWLVMGFTALIALPKTVGSFKWHKILGKVGMVAFVMHIAGAINLTISNPTNQVPLVTAVYWSLITESIVYILSGIAYTKYKKNKEKHTVNMLFGFLMSITGSGAIRLAAWLCWLIGKFLPLGTRILVDRGECQRMATDGYVHLGIEPTQAGSAEHCWKPVVVNLLLTWCVNAWIKWACLCCVHSLRTAAVEKKKIAGEFKHSCKMFAFSLCVALLSPYIKNPEVEDGMMHLLFISIITGSFKTIYKVAAEYYQVEGEPADNAEEPPIVCNIPKALAYVHNEPLPYKRRSTNSLSLSSLISSSDDESSLDDDLSIGEHSQS